MLAIARSQSRVARSLRALVFIGLVGAALAGYSTYQTGTDIRLATGPRSDAQRAFYLAAADRPDLQLFYRGLSPAQRLAMAQRLSDYSDAKIVALTGALLDTFDEVAREALASSLVKLGRTNPDAVADLLGASGSFQQIAIARTLRDRPDHSVDLVAARLSKPDTRANAAAYLIGLGDEAEAPLLTALNASDHDVQMVAADALGKLRSRRAVTDLHRLYDAAPEADQLQLMSALASIGAPSSETRLSRVLVDEGKPVSLRTQAALGLGRIGSVTAVDDLLRFVRTEDAQFRDSLITALGSCGDAALARIQDRGLGIRVAALVSSPRADETLRAGLRSSDLQTLAVEQCADRPGLVPDLVALARSTDDGQTVDRIFGSLATTEEGAKAIRSLQSDPRLGAWSARELPHLL